MLLPKDLLSGMCKKPNIYLCETDKSRICKLETFETKGSFKFNGLSELSFEVPRVYNDFITGETIINPFFDKIEALRLIYLEDIGYFELQGPELISNGIEEKKSCNTYSSEYALSQKYLENFKVNLGTLDSIEVDADGNMTAPIQLYSTVDTEHSLLHLALTKIYGWRIGHVDPQLWTLTRQFDIDRESVYDFLMNEVCEKFNCYIVFDTINNLINVYAESPTKTYPNCDGTTRVFTNGDPENGIAPFSDIETVAIDGYKTTKWTYSVSNGIGELILDEAPAEGQTVEIIGVDSTWLTDVFVSFDNLSQEVNVSYDADSIKTVLTITFGDDEDIREVNLGLPYLTDLNYYYSVEWMGQKLYDNYTKYLDASNAAKPAYTKNSKIILEYEDYISYEENRLSVEYLLAEDVGASTVGKYYTRHQKADGSYYYSEVSLPNEYLVDTEYYENVSTNLNETIIGDVYTILKKYFYAYFKGDAAEKVAALDDLAELADSFKFMKTYTISYLSNTLKTSTTQDAIDEAVLNFFGEAWSEVGTAPLKELYLTPYTTVQQTNIEAGWADKIDDKYNDNYGNYYPVVLLINSINTAITERETKIKEYRAEQAKYQKANSDIVNNLSMETYLDEDDMIRLSAFLREDELHIDDILTTDQDDLTGSFKVQQDAMESGRIELKKLSQPQLQFSMTMANIYALPEFEGIVQKFQLGNIIRIKLREMQTHKLEVVGDGTSTEFLAPYSFEGIKNIVFSDNNKIACRYDSKVGRIIFDSAPDSGVTIKITLANYCIKQSRLLQTDINFDDLSDFSCEFGELTSLRTQSDIHADLLSNAITAGKSVANNSSHWTHGADVATSTDTKIQQGLLDATTQIKAMDGNQGVIIDRTGIKLQKQLGNGEVDPHQTWMVNNMILMSDDGFKTSRSAIGQIKVDGKEVYGLLADAVIAGYIEGSKMVGGTISSTNYKSGESGTHFDLVNGSFEIAGGKIVYDSSDNEVKLKGVTIQWTGDDGVNAPEVEVKDVTGLEDYLEQLDILDDALSATKIGENYVVSPYIVGGYLNITNTTNNSRVIIDPNNLTGNNYIFQVRNGSKVTMGVDEDGNATFSGTIYATDGEFTGTVKGSVINGGSININDKFIVDSNGNVTISSGTVTGYVTNDTLTSQINSVNTNLTNNYSTTTQMNTAINQSADNVLVEANKTLNTTLDAYSTTEKMNAAIKLSADGVKSEVNKTLTSYSTTTQMNSAINQKANEITSSVNTTLKNYSTTTQMNSAISQSASNVKSEVNTEIKRLDGVDESLSSRITQNAGSISSEVTRATNAENALGTRITQTNDSITSVASRVTTNESNISKVTQTTTNLTSEVSKKVGNDEIISRINQSAEGIKIDANKLDINASDFNITVDSMIVKDTSGNTLFSAGNNTVQLSSWNVASHKLTNGEIDTNGYVGIYSSFRSGDGDYDEYGDYVGPGNGTAAIQGGHYSDSWRLLIGRYFGVDNTGSLYCSNASISGTIYASGGNVGCWNINSAGLWTGSEDGSEVGVSFGKGYLFTSLGSGWSQIMWRDIHNCAWEWKYGSSSESDINVKHSISNIDNYDAMFDGLKPCRYKYNHGTSDRYHTGFIAQEVVEAVEGAGLTTQDFAGVIHLEEPNDNGCEWVLRRDEFVALNTWQIQKLKSRVADLEAQIEELKAAIK